MMHAENGIAIDVLVEQALARGETDPRYHGEVRHELLEAEATHRAIKLAQVAGRAALHRARVGRSRRSPSVAAGARRGAATSFGETCPQYLFLSTDDLAAPGLRGRQVRLLDAAAARASTRPRCGGALRTNDLSVVSTDHCPFCFKEQKELGRRRLLEDPQRAAGRRAPDGPAATRAWSTATSRGARWIELACATPARMFGLYPRKGTIAPGADADVVIYDPHAAHDALGVATHHMNVDYSAYEGKEITGRVDTVLSRGRVVIDDGAVPRPAGPRPVPQARHVRLPALEPEGATWTSGSSCRPTRPARPVVDRMVRAEELRVQPRLDVRLARALAGAVRDLQPDPGARPAADRRADGDQPRHPRLDGDRVAVRHAQRACSATARSAASAAATRRCGCRAGKPTTLARLGAAIDVIRDLADGRRGRRRAARRCGSRGSRPGAGAAGLDGRRTGRRRWSWSAAAPTGSSCSSPTRTSSSGR